MSPLSGKNSEIWAQVAVYSSLGFVLAGGVGVGYLIGWLLDSWLGTKPVLALVVALLVFGGSLVEILRILERWEKRADRNHSGTGPGAS